MIHFQSNIRVQLKNYKLQIKIMSISVPFMIRLRCVFQSHFKENVIALQMGDKLEKCFKA